MLKKKMDAIERIKVNEKDDNQKGGIAAIVTTIGIILLLFLPLLSKLNPPPGQEGILINFGNLENGEGDAQPIGEELPEPPSPAEQPPPQPSQETTPSEEMTDDNSDIAIKPKKETPKKETPKKETPKQTTTEKPKTETTPSAPKPAEPTVTSGSTFGKKKTPGQGTGTGTGDAGNPDGDPNAGNLEGSSAGTGTQDIGGNLKGRGVAYRPTISDNSQKSGKVRIELCVDSDGKVTTASYTQEGSTTNDAELTGLALRAAKDFQFKKDLDAPDKQCGYITFTFKVK